jgi:hypothetical protein
MSIPREDLRTFLRQCDPNDPLKGQDRRYVPLDDVRGGDSMTCVDTLEQNIALLEESCQLFTGFPGTGKTTELRQLEDRLSRSKDLPTYVIYVNFEDYVDIYTPISIADILRILAYCLDREATQAEGADPDKKPGYLKRFFDFVAQTDVELPKQLDFSAYGTSFMLELKNNPDFRRRAEAALAGRFQRFADEARNTMTDAVLRLRKAQGAFAERVVVIADGLEKLTPLRDEDRETLESSVETLFVSHAHLVRLPCHVIYTFPLWLRYRRADLGASYDGEPLVLPMVKVAERGGAAFEHGLTKLTELIGRRVDIARVFGHDPSATLRPLLLASGGYPRDLLRMVRSLLTGVRTFPVRPEDAVRIVDRLAEDYSRTLFGTDLEVLTHVAATNALPRENREQLATFARLLERWLVLAYRNGSEGYDLHPMVRRDPMVAARLKPI